MTRRNPKLSALYDQIGRQRWSMVSGYLRQEGVLRGIVFLLALLVLFFCGLIWYAATLSASTGSPRSAGSVRLQSHARQFPTGAVTSMVGARSRAPSLSAAAMVASLDVPPRMQIKQLTIWRVGGPLPDSPPEYAYPALIPVVTPLFRMTWFVEASFRAMRAQLPEPLHVVRADSITNVPIPHPNSPTATAIATNTLTPSPSATPTATDSPTPRPTATATATATVTATPRPQPTRVHVEEVWVTGYSLSGTTALGGQAGPGICAVDPSYIPLGTIITIDGIGTCRAQDTGPDVIGAHVDVWVPTAGIAYAITGWHTARW